MRALSMQFPESRVQSCRLSSISARHRFVAPSTRTVGSLPGRDKKGRARFDGEKGEWSGGRATLINLFS